MRLRPITYGITGMIDSWYDSGYSDDQSIIATSSSLTTFFSSVLTCGRGMKIQPAYYHKKLQCICAKTLSFNHSNIVPAPWHSR
mgnify:CR=1 FL=1